MRKTIVLWALLLFAGAAHAIDPPTISVYGDSFVYRSTWQCDGLSLTQTQCDDLKADSSFVSYIEYPYSWTPTPWMTVVNIDGVGASTCLPRTGDPGVANRLSYAGERYIGIMIGINDVNLAGTSITDTVECLKDAWAIISDDYGATPIAFRYPKFSGTVWSITPTIAEQNRVALNSAISTAVSQFNASRPAGPRQAVLALIPNYTDATPYTYSDGVHLNPNGASLYTKFFFWTLN
jgi:hypothetical protein